MILLIPLAVFISGMALGLAAFTWWEKNRKDGDHEDP